MRLSLSSDPELQFLQRHILLEGHELVRTGGDFRIGGIGKDRPAMEWGTRLGSSSIQSMGLATTLGRDGDYYLSRYHSGGNWADQTYCGTPVRGTVEGGRGASIEVGSIGRWVRLSEEGKGLFEHEALSVLLGELKHSGWVSLRLLSAHPGVLQGLECGVPAWGLYAILEGAPEGLKGFVEDPLGTRWRESWSCSQVISTWPWPLSREVKKISVRAPSPEAEKHLWMRELPSFRGILTVDDPSLLGVASAWGSTPWASWARTIRTARGLRLQEGQWRGDGWESSEEVWKTLSRSRLFS